MTYEIALFPIPGAYCFPTNIVPFHVFEPRYRQMVQDCIRDQRMLAVTDVMGVLSQPNEKPKNQEEALNSNQATYVPQEIYGGGTVSIRETLPDGRLMIDLRVQHRFQTLRVVQQIPYLVVEAQILEDSKDAEDAETDRALLNNLITMLARIFSLPHEQIRKQIEHNVGHQLDLSAVTYQILGFIRSQPDVMREFMIQNSPRERALHLAELLAPPQSTSH